MVNGGGNILIINEDPFFRDALCEHFRNRPVTFFSAATDLEGLQVCARNKIDIVVLDQKSIDAKSAPLCRDILSTNDRIKIIVLTAHPGIGRAPEAGQTGVHAHLAEPFDMEEMDRAISTALRVQELERIELLQDYKKRKEMEATVLVGGSSQLFELGRMIDTAASRDDPVLITGEPGTGKGLVARAIHYRSRAKKSAYVSVNCSALSSARMEAELFGHEKGAFTDAVSTRRGFFELVGSGTLFLDAIEELSVHLQAKLLRALNDKKVKRVGGQHPLHVEARVITSVHVDPEDAVRNQNLRDDLYSRFASLKIQIPPLRERSGDVPELAHYFIKTIAPSNNLEIPADDLQVMMDYYWPGNVSELRNIIERSLLLRQGRVLRPAELLRSRKAYQVQLPAAHGLPADGRVSSPAVAPMKAVEKEHIRRALEVLSNNHSQTARALGISRSTLIRKMKAYGM